MSNNKLFALGAMAISFAFASSSIAFGQAVNTVESAQPAPDSQFKIITMQHLSAGDADAIIRQMFPREPIASSALPASNQLIVRANDQVIEVIEALLQQIDKPAQKSAGNLLVPPEQLQPAASYPTPQYGTYAEIVRESDARDDWILQSEIFRNAEDEARKTAAKLRTASKTMGENHPLRVELSAELQAQVNALFEQRQSAYARRIRDLEAKLTSLRQKVEKQRAARDQIIEQRIAQLMAGRVAARTAARPTKNPYAQAKIPPTPYATFSLNSPDPQSSLKLLTQVAETQNRIAKAEAELEAATAEMNRTKIALDEIPKNVATSESLGLEAQYRVQALRRQATKAELHASRRLYEVLKTQVTTQRDLLRNDVEQARLALSKAQRDFERASALESDNFISESEMDSIRTILDRTRLKFERAKKILDAFETQSK